MSVAGPPDRARGRCSGGNPEGDAVGSGGESALVLAAAGAANSTPRPAPEISLEPLEELEELIT